MRKQRSAWNKGRLLGRKPPLKPKEIWSLRIRLQLADKALDLALFNLAVDSKLRGCDLVSLRVRDVYQGCDVSSRAIVMQRKTQPPVQFEIGRFRPEAVVALTTFLSDERIHPLPPLVTGRYRHYQGGECEALGIVRHSETLEPKVLYRALYRARGLWVRPHVMYFESIGRGWRAQAAL